MFVWCFDLALGVGGSEKKENLEVFCILRQCFHVWASRDQNFGNGL